jgi:hypothetical protein
MFLHHIFHAYAQIIADAEDFVEAAMLFYGSDALPDVRSAIFLIFFIFLLFPVCLPG